LASYTCSESEPKEYDHQYRHQVAKKIELNRTRTITPSTSTTIAIVLASLTLLLVPASYSSPLITEKSRDSPVPQSDTDLLEFPLNLEYLEAEFFLYGSLGQGLDKFAPNLSTRGPPPLGARVANLDPFTRDAIIQFAWQELGHLRSDINFFTSFGLVVDPNYDCILMMQSNQERFAGIPRAIAGLESKIICTNQGCCSWESIVSTL
jgi:hypothetical protein